MLFCGYVIYYVAIMQLLCGQSVIIVLLLGSYYIINMLFDDGIHMLLLCCD